MRQIKLLLLAVVVALIAACSTTARLGEGEILYTGVSKVRVTAPDSVEIPSGISDNIHMVIDVPANNSLYSPYIRSPFPVGLWLYNHWSPDSKGLKGWIYNKFAEEPVLMSDVRPDLRMRMVEDMLDKSGYFGSTTSYEYKYNRKNPRKTRVIYNVHLATPKRIVEIIYPDDTIPVAKELTKYLRRDKYLRKGMIFNNDSLATVRVRVTERVRNKGYYYFRPEFLTYYADTVSVEEGVVVKVAFTDNIPERALHKLYVGKITTMVRNNTGVGTIDTFETKRGTVYQMKPSRLRKNLIPSCITTKTGDVVSVRRLSNTQAYLSRLGIFNYISVQPTPLDSLTSDTLNLDIFCNFDKPLETQLEANVTSKSNSYLGPGLSFLVSNRNIFGGGERLTVKLDGAYEWQVGKVEGKRSQFSSYEIGLSTELAFPRLLAPSFIPITQRELNWTRFKLGGTLMNRPRFFRMVQFEGSMEYDWMSSRFSRNHFTLFGLKYNKLLNTTASFDETMAQNPAIALSFEDQFIPKMDYTYTFTKSFGRRRKNSILFQGTLIEGGNIFSGLWAIGGSKNGEKRLFGTRFSQFMKAVVQTVYTRKIVGDHKIVSRVYVGAAQAYGNSQEVPYGEQFYVGGANSIRAFPVRSIGPGSYKAADRGDNTYYDQTGTFRFEMNMEYRFPIAGMLKGAVFMDAGNIWLLKDDPARPGGKITGDNFFRDLALGTGLGLRFDMGMIVVRGDLGVGIHLPYDTGHSGYYNMGKFGSSLAFNLAIGYPF